VLDMLDAIGKPENAAEWLAAELKAGQRLMGFGHRIYRVRDPRADVLKRVVGTLRSEGNSRLAFAEHVEREALRALAAHKPDRPLDTNVEFYTALLLEAVGLEREAFTPVFAMGRVVGWTAHVFEQERTGRLMRPQSAYVGPVAVTQAG
jgi:citrate synthase